MLFNKFLLLEQKAKNFGFYWESISGILVQMKSECQEILIAPTINSDLYEELGDLLHSIISLALFLQLDLSHELDNIIHTLDNNDPKLARYLDLKLLQSIIDRIDYIIKQPSNYIFSKKTTLELLHIACNLVHYSGSKCSFVLNNSLHKFNIRFNTLVGLTQEQKLHNLRDSSNQYKRFLWSKVKRILSTTT